MRGKKKIIIVLSAILCVVTTIVYALLSVKKSKDLSGLSAEMLMEMKYDQVEDADTKVDGCDGIKFSAFFTRDLDNDGKAEKIKGTCKEIGQNDTLYVELNVLTQGYLKDGVITLDAKNFTWTTAIVSDNVVEGDYIGNTKEIKLKEQLNAGTQKTLIYLIPLL